MRRRDFIALLGGSALELRPLVARAQSSAMPVIGFLNSEASDLQVHRVGMFKRGLGERGYVEGQNLQIEYRWANSQYDRLPDLAAELVRRQVDMIVANLPAAIAAQKLTRTIPIVFTTSSDPVRLGLVDSLNHPGGNITGTTQLNVEVGPKRLELLHELVPAAKRFAVLLNPASSNVDAVLRDVQTAAQILGLQVHILQASSERDIEAVFRALDSSQTDALVVGPDAFLGSRSEQLGVLALRRALPAIAQSREFAIAGGLMGYGGNVAEPYRLAGIYAGRILKGEEPADLPVQQATKVELIINLKTAKALGLTVPLTLLGRADEVIE